MICSRSHVLRKGDCDANRMNVICSMMFCVNADCTQCEQHTLLKSVFSSLAWKMGLNSSLTNILRICFHSCAKFSNACNHTDTLKKCKPRCLHSRRGQNFRMRTWSTLASLMWGQR